MTNIEIIKSIILANLTYFDYISLGLFCKSSFIWISLKNVPQKKKKKLLALCIMCLKLISPENTHNDNCMHFKMIYYL